MGIVSGVVVEVSVWLLDLKVEVELSSDVASTDVTGLKATDGCLEVEIEWSSGPAKDWNSMVISC